MKLLVLCMGCFLGIHSLNAQNLLNTASWTLGSGSVSGFSQNGSTSENWRILYPDHLGREVITWEARNDAASNADGGWNSTYTYNMSNTKTYRFSVWIKKTNSNAGSTYFGAQSYQSNTTVHNYTILNLNGSVNRNPYFWRGDLPQLDRWYLLVGFIHHKNYSSSTSMGAIYDGVTGEKVDGISVKDFKFSNATTRIRHRAYLYYDTNINDRQYFLEPRMEEVNGLEPSIEDLMDIYTNSSLVFAFDNAGSQKQRFYCSVVGCEIPDPPNGFAETYENAKTTQAAEAKETVADQEMIADEDVASTPKAQLFPNPANTTITVAMAAASAEVQFTETIQIYNATGAMVLQIPLEARTTYRQIDVSSLAAGTYLLHAHLSNGQRINKRFIKK